VEIQAVEMLTLIGGLCCVGFTQCDFDFDFDFAGVQRQRLARLNKFHLKIETEFSLRNAVY
jgi:hypothetical protein